MSIKSILDSLPSYYSGLIAFIQLFYFLPQVSQVCLSKLLMGRDCSLRGSSDDCILISGFNR